MIHEHIRLKKAENEADEDSAGQRRRELPEESDDTLNCQRIVKEEKASIGKGAGNST